MNLSAKAQSALGNKILRWCMTQVSSKSSVLPSAYFTMSTKWWMKISKKPFENNMRMVWKSRRINNKTNANTNLPEKAQEWWKTEVSSNQM